MQNRVCLVVGAGDGLGASIVKEFVRQGYQVIAARRSAKPEQNSESVTWTSCDARLEDDVKKLFDLAGNKGKLQVVVHNIGANVTFPVVDTTERVFRKVWEMCALSGFLCGREAARRMVPQGSGCIIFTGATASTRGAAGYVAFGAAMASKRSIAQSMARELGEKNIHVAHVVIDGPIDSSAVEKRAGTEMIRMMREKQALLRTEEIAKIYSHIAAQEKTAWTFETDVRPWCEKF